MYSLRLTLLSHELDYEPETNQLTKSRLVLRKTAGKPTQGKVTFSGSVLESRAPVFAITGALRLFIGIFRGDELPRDGFLTTFPRSGIRKDEGRVKSQSRIITSLAKPVADSTHGDLQRTENCNTNVAADTAINHLKC